MANKAKEEQVSVDSSSSKVSGKSIVKAYNFVASEKLGDLSRIYPKTTGLIPKFSSRAVKESYGRLNREQLVTIFDETPPNEIESNLKLLIEVGFLRPENIANPLSSEFFEIPFVYKTPLGIKSSGRRVTNTSSE